MTVDHMTVNHMTFEHMTVEHITVEPRDRWTQWQMNTATIKHNDNWIQSIKKFEMTILSFFF